MKTIFKITLLITFIFASTLSIGQVVTETIKPVNKVLVKMKNGEEYKGQIVKKDSDFLVLQTENGEIKLKASNVNSIESYNYSGKFEFPNANDTRYFFGANGIPIEKGKGYYQNVMVTTNFVNYGITENISVGGGFEFISTLSGSPIWFLTPKIGFNVADNVHVGGGFIMAGLAGEGAATLAYGVFTFGHSESNVSLGAGYGIVDGNFSNAPSIMVSGIHRVSTGLAILSENYILSNGIGGSSYFGIQGIRLLSRKNAFDLGAILLPEIMEFIPALPYVGYVRSF